MRIVSKKTGVSKKVARVRRMLAKARREDRAEVPISDEIRRAAKRAGITPGQLEAAEAVSSPESMAEWSAKRAAFANQPLTLTLAEACDLVAHDLKPSDFQEQVFEVIAREVDTLSDLAEHGSGEAGFDGWCAFQTLCHRIRLAGKIAAVFGGAS